MKQYTVKKKLILTVLTAHDSIDFSACVGDQIAIEGNKLYFIHPRTKELIETINVVSTALCNEGYYEGALEEIL